MELARFELGNLLWKEYALHSRITAEELESLIDLIKRVLNTLSILGIGCREREIMKVAEELRVTFYDASYVYYAKEMVVPLVTEDRRLHAKAKSLVKVLAASDILRR